MTDCMCNIDVSDYDIELIQGDYGDFIYEITNEDGTYLEHVSNVVFTCNRLNYRQDLTFIDNKTWALRIKSEDSEKFSVGTGSYDITLMFDDEGTPHTVIYNASITILKKENKLHESKDV